MTISHSGGQRAANSLGPRQSVSNGFVTSGRAPRHHGPPQLSVGDLVPRLRSLNYLGDASKSAVVANLSSAEDGSYISLHFLRGGRWTVPLLHTGVEATHRKVGSSILQLDYWSMNVTVIATLSSNASSVVLDVSALPGNYEIARSSSGYVAFV